KQVVAGCAERAVRMAAEVAGAAGDEDGWHDGTPNMSKRDTSVWLAGTVPDSIPIPRPSGLRADDSAREGGIYSTEVASVERHNLIDPRPVSCEEQESIVGAPPAMPSRARWSSRSA